MVKDTEASEEQIDHGNSWIIYILAAASFFTVCNALISDVSTLGLEGLLFLSPGALLCGIVFFGYQLAKEVRERRVCWTYLNFMDEQTN